MREHRLTPDIIISSDAVRARRTAEAVAEATRYSGEIRWRDLKVSTRGTLLGLWRPNELT